MAINTIADIVARSTQRSVFTFDALGDSSTLSNLLAANLRRLGWTGTGKSFTSRNIGSVVDNNSNSYARTVTVTWTIVNTLELELVLTDPSSLLVQTVPLRLRAVSGKCYIMGSPYQFIIAPSVPAVDQATCIVSILNLPRFSPYLTAIVGMEGGSFIRNLWAVDFTRFVAFTLTKDRIVSLHNANTSDRSAPSIPTFQAKTIVAYAGPFGVKSPTWICWGAEPGNAPTLKGFLWDTFLFYDNRFTSAFERKVIDTRASLQLSSVASNILVFEYGSAN